MAAPTLLLGHPHAHDWAEAFGTFLPWVRSHPGTAVAANRQVRTGHFRPAVRPAVYRVNSESDADHDGTACEAGERRG